MYFYEVFGKCDLEVVVDEFLKKFKKADGLMIMFISLTQQIKKLTR